MAKSKKFMTVDGNSATTLASLKLDLKASNNQTMSVTGSAAPRRNVSH